MRSIAAVCVVCLVALAACGSSHRAAPHVRGQWLTLIKDEARSHPAEQFANLSKSVFRQRLDAAAARYGFTVERLAFLHPAQLAPLVIVRSGNPRAFSRAVPAVERSLDPLRPGRRHVSFEAFYLEGQDTSGTPFVVVWNEYRGEIAGGQWARAEALYPFPHG